VIGILDPKKGIKQLARIVTTNAKYHSSLPKASQFTAETVLEKENQKDFNLFSFFI
jgi:hypothetical protein